MSNLGFVEPQLLTAVEQPPQGSNWIHEVKHGGYRTLLVIEGGKARAYTRNGFDSSERYPGIVSAAVKLPCRSAILDGEVIVQDERGVPDFESLSIRYPVATAQAALLCLRHSPSRWRGFAGRALSQGV